MNCFQYFLFNIFGPWLTMGNRNYEKQNHRYEEGDYYTPSCHVLAHNNNKPCICNHDFLNRKSLNFYFWLLCQACGNLSSLTRVGTLNSQPSAVKAQSLNHGTARGFPEMFSITISQENFHYFLLWSIIILPKHMMCWGKYRIMYDSWNS